MRQRPRCESICSVTRMLSRLNRLQHALPRRSSTYATYISLCAPTRPRPHCRPYTPLRTHSYSSAAMTHPVASSSHPAQLPALETPHAADAQGGTPKKPKDKKKADAASQHPLEVRSSSFFFILCVKKGSRTCSRAALARCNPPPRFSTIASRYSTGSRRSTMRSLQVSRQS